jgi:hypothetical protein
MAFEVTVSNGGTCDKCGKPGELISIYQATRQDKNIVYVHESCLLKLIAKTKKSS